MYNALVYGRVSAEERLWITRGDGGTVGLKCIIFMHTNYN